MAKEETETKRISDAEWERQEVAYLEKYVDYKTALALAKRNVKNRDAIDALRPKF